MKKYILLSLVMISGIFLAVPAFAAGDGLTLNKDYTILAAPVTKTPEPKGVVNVKEFFNFACIHCKDVDPLVEQTFAKDKGVDLEKIQTVWGTDPNMVGFAKLNATIRALKLNQLYTPAFIATFANQNLNDPAVLQAFLKQNGLTPAQINRFMSTYNSFTISAKAGEYRDMLTTYNITGTPTFIIADKYVANPAQPPQLMKVVNALIKKARADSRGK